MSINSINLSIQRLFENLTNKSRVYTIRDGGGQYLTTITIANGTDGYHAFVSLHGKSPIGHGYSSDMTQAVQRCIIYADAHNNKLPASILGLAEIMRIERHDWIEIVQDYGYIVEKII